MSRATFVPGDDNTHVFSGTLVVKGQGTACPLHRQRHRARQDRRGPQATRTRTDPLQVEVDHLVRNLALLGGSLCLLVIVVYGLSGGDWLHGTLAGITLAMACAEEFP